MNKNVHLYFGGVKIGTLNHKFIYDDEANSGRSICDGALLVLQDFRYRAKNVTETSDGFVVELVKDTHSNSTTH